MNDVLFDIDKLREFEKSQKLIDSASIDNIDNIAEDIFEIYHDKLDIRCLIRDLIYFGCIRPKIYEVYVKLIEKVLQLSWSEKENNLIKKSLQYKHHCLLNGSKSEPQLSPFLLDLCTRNIIQACEFRYFGSQDEKLWNLLVNDDLDALVEYSTHSDFDINFKFKYDSIKDLSLINISILFSSINCFKYLIVNGAELDFESYHAAIKGGSNEIIRLIEQSQGTTPNFFQDAVVYHRYDLAMWLTEDESDFSFMKQVCMESGNIVSLLDFHERLEIPLKGSPFDVQFPTVHFIDAYTDGFFFLHNILAGMPLHKDVDRLDMCVERGVSIDTFIDSENYTIFACFAASGGPLFKYIASLGANPNVLDIFEMTCLNLAIEVRNLESVKFLIENCNASVNIPQDPLSQAASNGSLNIVKYLITVDGIDINKVTQDGMTPLLLAAEQNHQSVVDFLLTLPNINKDAQNHYGKKYTDFL